MYRQQLITAVQSTGFSMQVSLVCPALPIPVTSRSGAPIPVTK